jgi:enoyl-CoA hydratase
MSLIRTDIHDRVAVVTLDDPGRRNAITPAMVDEIVATFDRLEADPIVGAVVVTGAPPAFCAGADLSELEGAVREGLLILYHGFLRINRSPLPTVAAVNGPAVGAGVNLALVCDLRLAATSARFDSRFIRLGLHPGGGHAWMLERTCGQQTATAMALFGEILDGDAAVQRGLAWRCVRDEELMETALAIARRTSTAPPELVGRIKATLKETSVIRSHSEAVEHELEHQEWSVQQPEFANRLAAMRQRIGGD